MILAVLRVFVVGALRWEAVISIIGGFLSFDKMTLLSASLPGLV